MCAVKLLFCKTAVLIIFFIIYHFSKFLKKCFDISLILVLRLWLQDELFVLTSSSPVPFRNTGIPLQCRFPCCPWRTGKRDPRRLPRTLCSRMSCCNQSSFEHLMLPVCRLIWNSGPPRRRRLRRRIRRYIDPGSWLLSRIHCHASQFCPEFPKLMAVVLRMLKFLIFQIVRNLTFCNSAVSTASSVVRVPPKFVTPPPPQRASTSVKLPITNDKFSQF